MHPNDPIYVSYPELLLKDFDERLAQLVELAGLSWEEFAARLGVGCDRVTDWRRGQIPTGGEMWLIMRFASSAYGGTELMLHQCTAPDEGGEHAV